MKKIFLILCSIVLVSYSSASVFAKSDTANISLTSAIKLYKSGNYAQSYIAFNKLIEKDPSNAVAYYYLAMSSAQLGKKDEAINNYNKVLSLSPNNKLGDYASKGLKCIQEPDKCNEPVQKVSDSERFIMGPYGYGFSDEARSEFEKQKIENLMREMNRDRKDIEHEKFNEYKDFSSQAPTNDEIVHAIKILQKAGLGDIINTNRYGSDLSILTGNNNTGNIEMLNMLMGGASYKSQLSPQVIQSLLTNQMSAGL